MRSRATSTISMVAWATGTVSVTVSVVIPSSFNLNASWESCPIQGISEAR